MNKKYLEIYRLMEQLKHQSRCIDKQVVCILTDANYNIISYGVNEIAVCDKNCHDKENRDCRVIHAEVAATQEINIHILRTDVEYAFVNLFPCAKCQQHLMNSCSSLKKIITFTPKHKEQVFDNIEIVDNISDLLLDYDGKEKQLSVIQGELCELVTCISDYFYREDKDLAIETILDEIIDVEIMLMQLKKILWQGDNETYNKLREMQPIKYEHVIRLIKTLHHK